MENQSSILVIDDEQIICDSCNRILEKENYKVDTDTNPTEGIQKALTNNYDLILLDLNMRELDGIQFLMKLRKDKPDVPVIIITGYPTKETKEESKSLGVSNYILKPFKPNEILEPVNSIIKRSLQSQKKVVADTEIKEKLPVWDSLQKNYLFYKNAWLQQGNENIVRIGGQIPALKSEQITSIKTVGVNDEVFRGFPIAEINFADDNKIIIPSPVSGKVIEINANLIANPSLFEEDNKNSWIASINANKLDEEILTSETRNIVLFSSDEKDKSNYYDRLTNLGYIVNKTDNIDKSINIVSKEQEKVIVFDAKSFAEKGPQYANTIKEKFSDAKIIVFNTTNASLETLYREKKIFYYAVDPIQGKEISSILYDAFCYTKDREINENNQTTFLPQTINRISITNRHSKKVVLMVYDNILQVNKGAGYLLIQKLLNNSYPIEIDHTKNISRFNDPSANQKISQEKLKSEKIITLFVNDLNRISGSIAKQTETYKNSMGSDNQHTKIAIQPAQINNNEITFDLNTAKALAELIEHEMTSK